MITRIKIQNYRSFVDAEVKLRPFSLVVGANGSGKSNLLRFFQNLRFGPAWNEQAFVDQGMSVTARMPWQKHVNNLGTDSSFEVLFENAKTPFGVLGEEIDEETFQFSWRFPWATDTDIPIFNLNSGSISGEEPVIATSVVKGDGAGTAQVLESLKNGDREDLFDSIHDAFRRYVPEVEKLSLRTLQNGLKQIQVREKGLNQLLPATELSEGTRLVLCILTILHQENPPPIILLEDIDRGLHPRLFEYVAPMMKDIAERHQINILATTHNPYLVDCFQDDKKAVIIVEKKDGASTLSTLADRLKDLDYDKVDPDDMPLGNLWFSGLVGGVPRPINRRPQS